MAITELGKAPDPMGAFDFVRIPLKRSGNLILLEAQADGQTGYFILDTGAPYLVLNSTYFQNGREVEERVMQDVAGFSDTVRVTAIERLDIRSLYFESLEADLVNLGAIENRRGVKILGLMGLNLFLNVEMRFDLRNLSLELHRTNKSGECIIPAENCEIGASSFDFKLRNNVILLKGSVDGRKLNFCLDTGAEVTVLSNDLNEDVYEQVSIQGSKSLIGSSGQATEVLFGVLNNLHVGSSHFKGARGYHRLEGNEQFLWNQN